MFLSYLKVLKNKNFLFIWLAQIVSQFGDRLSQIAFVGLVYNALGTTSVGLAKVMFFTIIPVFLINPVAGVYVDRWDKRKIMYSADFIRASLMLFLGIYLLNSRKVVFPVLYLIIFLSFCVGRFFVPAKMAILPVLVRDNQVIMANSLISVTANIAAILGFGLGGIIVENWSPEGALILDGLTFLISSLFIFFMNVKPQGRFKRRDLLDLSRDVVKRETSLFKEFKEGVRYLFSRQSTLISMKSLSLLFSCLGALYVVFIIFIQECLGSATRDLGFLAVWLGAGLFIGSLVYGRVATKYSLFKTIDTMLMLSSLLLIIFSIIIKITHSGVLASLFSFFLGAFSSPIVVGANSLIHKKSKDNYWGRIFSGLEVVIHLSFLLFMFITSILADIFSPFSIILTVGIIIFIYSFISLFSKNQTDASFRRT